MTDEEVAKLDLTGWPLPNEYLIELGRVSAIWASMEKLLNVCIAKLAGFDPINDPKPFILITHSTFPQRLDNLGALCEHLAPVHPWLGGYKDVITALRAAQTLRNRFLHNAIIVDPLTGACEMPLGSARGKLKVSVEQMSLTDIKRALLAIDEAQAKLYKLVLRRDIGPLSKRLAERSAGAAGEDAAAQRER